VHETRFGADDFRQMRQEGNDVVFDLALDLVDALDVELGRVAFFPDFCSGFFGNNAELRQRIGGVSFDLEPDTELGLGDQTAVISGRA